MQEKLSSTRWVGPGGSFSMRRGLVCFDREGGGTTGLRAADIAPIAEAITIESDEDATRVLVEGRKEYNRLLSTFKDAETRWDEQAAGWEKRMKDAAERADKLEERLKDANRTAPAWKVEDGSLRHMAKRIQPPPGMDAAHFATTVLSPQEMRGIANLQDEQAAAFNPYVRTMRKQFDVNDQMAARIEEFHALSDTLLIADIALAGRHEDTRYAKSGKYAERVKSLPWYADYRKLAVELARAMSTSTSSNVGEDWVPYFMSANLKLLIQAQTLVAGLFEEISMPTAKYDYPVEGQDADVYFIGEATGDSEATNVISTSTPKTAKITLQAVKLATRILLSHEVLEDSIINLASDVLRRIGKAFARGIDDVLMNGDILGATHQDTDSRTAKDRRWAWNGLRKHALISGMPNVDLATFTSANLLSIRRGMGVYGATPGRLAWIVGFRGMIEMMKLAELITMDKYGPNASVRSGEVAKFFGSPVILSEFCREDLTANAVYDGVTTTKGSILCVNRDAFTRGERRALTIMSSDDRHIETDQTVLVGTWRGDFKPWFTTAAGANKIVGIGRNF